MPRTEDYHPEYAGIIAEAVVYHLKEACDAIQIVGGLRRKMDRVKGVSIVYISKLERVPTQESLFGTPSSEPRQNLVELELPKLEWFLKYRLDNEGEPISKIGKANRFKAMYDIATGVPIDLFPVITTMEWGVALTLKTGPAKFIRKLEQAARRRGYKWNGHRVTTIKGRKWTPASTEEEFFDICGVRFVPPERRS
jgi:DNA polymerase/3'-5' exonuclease PolX